MAIFGIGGKNWDRKKLSRNWTRIDYKETFAQLCELRIHLAGAQIEPQQQCVDEFLQLKADFDHHFNEVKDDPARIDFSHMQWGSVFDVGLCHFCERIARPAGNLPKIYSLP